MTRAEMKERYNLDVSKVKMVKGNDGIRYWYSEKSSANGGVYITYTPEDGYTADDLYMELFGNGTSDLSDIESR